MKKNKWMILGLTGLAAVALVFGMGILAPDSQLLENEEEGIFIEDEGVPRSDLPSRGVPGQTEPPAEEPEPETPADTWEGLDETQIAYVKEIVELVNEAREEAGLAPLTLDPALRSAAQVRAKECVSTFSHTRPNGTPYKTAIAEAGVESKYTGENVATGQKTAQKVMQSWMNSEGHRANILNENFTKIGVGLEPNVGNRYKGYAWAQLFAK